MSKVSFNLIEQFLSDSSLDEINSNRNKIIKLKNYNKKCDRNRINQKTKTNFNIIFL